MNSASKQVQQEHKNECLYKQMFLLLYGCATTEGCWWFFIIKSFYTDRLPSFIPHRQSAHMASPCFCVCFFVVCLSCGMPLPSLHRLLEQISSDFLSFYLWPGCHPHLIHKKTVTFLHPRNISKIRRLQSQSDAKKLVHAHYVYTGLQIGCLTNK